MASVETKKDDLWVLYAKTKSTEIRDELMLKYIHLVKFVAGRLSIYFGSNVEYDDLIGYGVFGLIDAIEKFDVKKGVKFETYASLRIRGAIIDSIREMDWVPRSLRQKNKELERLYAELESELGHSASDQEMAERMGISVEKFHKLLNEVSISSMLSLEDFLEQNYEVGVESTSGSKDERPDSFAEINEIKRILADSIEKLPEKEKMVVTLYYFEELTLKEISAIMNVTESRISQLHTKAILRLRGKLARHRSLLVD